MKNEIVTKMSPEGLEIANAYLELGNLPSVCARLGVDENMLPHLFDRFFRADESRSRTSGGSGLGLAICKNLVEAQAGQIEALANQPRGLCIRISLPLVRENQA